jgi:5-methylcytosine-specific restriction endonuclease McrA
MKRTYEHRRWRARVIRRDGACVVCGTRKSRQAHHMNSYSYFPEERYDVDNGITLCKTCHTKFHCDYKRSFRQKCTKYEFRNFMALVGYIKGIAEPAGTKGK